jgi:RHS repeat-associated protein
LAGQYFDGESGLHQNWHRTYSPAIGRYLTPDPIGLTGGINLYLYTLNNPTNRIDKYGLEVIDPDFGFPNFQPSPVNIGKLVTGVLSVTDGGTMLSVAFGVTVGTGVLTRSPSLTGAMGVMMIPVAVGGGYDVLHGILLIYEAFEEGEKKDM